MPTPVLFCCDPLNARRVDGHFAAEADAVRAAGGTVGLLDHDALLHGDHERAVARVPTGLGDAWYRGWMIPSGRYTALARALDGRGCRLVVAPDRYGAAHELPGWYRVFAGLTPASVWSPLPAGQEPAAQDLAALAARLRPGPGIVKDYVKSRKHEWDRACFIPDLTDTAALTRVVRTFAELQGEFLAGGIVLREYEPFVEPADGVAQVRIWWLDGAARLVTPHPDGPFAAVPTLDPAPFASAVRRLGCRFVTTDLARRADAVRHACAIRSRRTGSDVTRPESRLHEPPRGAYGTDGPRRSSPGGRPSAPTRPGGSRMSDLAY